MSVWLKVRAHVAEPMFRNAYALILNTVLSTGFGLLFWVLSARWFAVDDVGRGQTAINTMILLSGIGSLRLSGVIIRYLPSSGNLAGGLLWRAALIAGSGSVVVAGVYGVFARAQLADMLWAGFGAFVLFVVATAGWTLFTLQDAVMIGLRRSTWVPVQNAAFSALKVVALFVAAALGAAAGAGILLAWVVPMFLVLVPAQLLISRVVRGEHSGPPSEQPGWRRISSFAGADYLATLTEIVIVNGIPVMVAAMLGFEAAGVFATTWIIGTTLDHVLIHFGSSLTVEGVREPGQLASHARRLLVRSFAILVPLSCAVVLVAPVLLGLFGPRYAEDGTLLLQLLALAMVPRIVQTIVVVIAKVRHKLRLALAISLSQAVVIVLGSAWLAEDIGIAGPGVAYLVASTVIAIVLVPLLRALLRAGADHGPASSSERPRQPVDAAGEPATIGPAD